MGDDSLSDACSTSSRDGPDVWLAGHCLDPITCDIDWAGLTFQFVKLSVAVSNVPDADLHDFGDLGGDQALAVQTVDATPHVDVAGSSKYCERVQAALLRFTLKLWDEDRKLYSSQSEAGEFFIYRHLLEDCTADGLDSEVPLSARTQWKSAPPPPRARSWLVQDDGCVEIYREDIYCYGLQVTKEGIGKW